MLNDLSRVARETLSSRSVRHTEKRTSTGADLEDFLNSTKDNAQNETYADIVNAQLRAAMPHPDFGRGV